MCRHVCRCGEAEFCVLCLSMTYSTKPEYKSETRLVIEVSEIHDQETIEYNYRYFCDKHRISEDECLLLGKKHITDEERKNSHCYGEKYKTTYSIQNKNEMMALFAIPENLIRLEYCKDENDEYIDQVFISNANYDKIKQMSEQNDKIVREEKYLKK